MDWLSHSRAAFSHLMASKLRSLLAMLGIVVGTGAVVALLSCGQMAADKALSQIKSLGTDVISMMLLVKPGVNADESRGLTSTNLSVIHQASKNVTTIAPIISLFKNIYASGVSGNVPIVGVNKNFYSILKMHLSTGRIVTMLDREQLFCVIGQDLAKKIQLKGVDPLYSQLLVGNEMLTVVGILQPWKPSMLFYENINNGIVVSLPTAELLARNDEIKKVLIKISSESELDSVKHQLESTITPLIPDRVIRFQDPQSIIDVASKQQSTFTLLLASIGGIALLVGGIGVMNIMLVSVIERRKEIGVRMAIGAQRSDILKMFLMEAVVLTVLGGAMGVLIGLLVSLVLAMTSGWEYHFYELPPLLGFFVSVLVGVISGIYPAFNASRLDPVETFTD
ncbi:MAG: ABC transporter substrate-binding protein [Coxiellaceae bacterium]|nr:ABC transporter substrate-binding protein [Coxiellaceae bacterium]|tara:strand:- start:6203 stop:7387 length:1185 start_codon:yes stop_codon:yes gene_type:complete